jgi:hypothetical protein
MIKGADGRDVGTKFPSVISLGDEDSIDDVSQSERKV